MSAKNEKIKQTMRETQARRKTQTCRVFQLKLQSNALNKQQAHILSMLFVEAKWLYNHALSQGVKDYTPGKSVVVKNRKGEFEERSFSHLGSQMKQSVVSGMLASLRSLKTHKDKGTKVGALKFVSSYSSLDLKQYGTTYRFKKGRVRIQNVPGWLKIRGHHQLEGWELANAKLVQKTDGYYLHVTAFKNKTEIPDTYTPDTMIGVDMGLSTHLTFSNGEKVSSVVGESDRLKRLSKKLARQTKGSNNHTKTKQLIRKQHQKLVNKRDDTANKVVHQLLLNETVFIQNENLTAWRKSFGGSQQHSILGRVKSKLIHHPRVKVLRANAPTTKTCLCGVKNTHTLSQRTYKCSTCGYECDRDVHAARNMIRLTIPAEHRDFKLVERESDWNMLSIPQHPSKKQEASTASA